MKCQNCRFNLICLAGRLGSPQTLVSLCPTCGRLLISPVNEPDVFLFKCEKRPLDKQTKRTWRHVVEEPAKKNERPVPAAFHIPDPGPGMTLTDNLLLVRECVRCTNFLRMLPGGRIVDLDELAVLAEENRDHVFKLR